jgi:hypothetical protein
MDSETRSMNDPLKDLPAKIRELHRWDDPDIGAHEQIDRAAQLAEQAVLASERIAAMERERDRLRRVIDECQCGCHETGETHSGMRRTIADLRVRLNFLKSKGLTVTKMTDQNGERLVYMIADDSELDDKPTVNKLFAAEIALTQSQQQCEAMEQLYRDCRKSLWSYDAQDPEIFDAETTANIARAKASTHSETAKPE